MVMGQALIRNLEDDLLSDYREAARRNQRSLEAELRDALTRARPMSANRKDDLVKRLSRIRAMADPHVRQTPAEMLVREDRDGYRDA
jgi:antitoxin FitA